MPLHLVPVRDRKLFRLVKHSVPVNLVKGRSLYTPGDPARDVFMVHTGFIRLVLPGMEKGAGDRTVSVAVPWELFGDEAFVGGHRRYGAVAGSRALYFLCPKVRFWPGSRRQRRV
ncbi:MAG: hypothetical protein CM1200mP14_14330 [Gammaproteobacteria bacterium]|nr:MAG: hypothetical protein CM1200mP14_14330 [Gammaproteobacteria bacterium]